MKKVIVGMMLMSLMCAGAQAMVLDTMDNIAGTQWIETRGTALMQQSSFSHEGTGSMRIAYEQNTNPNLWDVVPQRYFYSLNPPFTPPHNNGLDMTNPAFNTLTFWVYSDAQAGSANVVQVLLYDAYGSPGPAKFDVADVPGGGWQKIVAPQSAFHSAPAGFHWEYIQTFQFWISTWDTRGTTSLYIDDMQLVPEPATIAVLGLGALFAARRKK